MGNGAAPAKKVGLVVTKANARGLAKAIVGTGVATRNNALGVGGSSLTCSKVVVVTKKALSFASTALKTGSILGVGNANVLGGTTVSKTGLACARSNSSFAGRGMAFASNAVSVNNTLSDLMRKRRKCAFSLKGGLNAGFAMLNLRAKRCEVRNDILAVRSRTVSHIA